MTTTPPSPIRTALVPGRAAGHRVEAVGIARDARHRVLSLSRPGQYRLWATSRARFSGAAVLLGDDGGRLVETTVDDTATLAVGEGRLIGIIDPDDGDTPALWLSWSLDAITVDPGDGATTTSHRRLRSLRLRGDEVELAVAGVTEVVEHRYRPGRESQFVDALNRLSV